MINFRLIARTTKQKKNIDDHRVVMVVLMMMRRNYLSSSHRCGPMLRTMAAHPVAIQRDTSDAITVGQRMMASSGGMGGRAVHPRAGQGLIKAVVGLKDGPRMGTRPNNARLEVGERLKRSFLG